MKYLASLLVASSCLLFSCGSASASNSSGGSPHKGEEIVTTIDKSSFESLITNAGLIAYPDADLTIEYSDEMGQHSLIKLYNYAAEFDMVYPGGDGKIAPTKYYSIDSEKAQLYVMDPYSGGIASYMTVTHDEAIKDITDSVSVVGSGFAYDSFTYSNANKSYHADKAKASSGVDLSDVDFYFQNGQLVKVTGKEVIEGSENAFTILCYDYGKTRTIIPM